MSTITITPEETGNLAPNQNADGTITPPQDAAQQPEGTTAAPTQAASEEQPAPSQGEAPADPLETRKQVDSVLHSSGLNLASFEEEFNTGGALSTESYASLEKAGFPKAVVDTYIKGLQGDYARMEVLAEKEVASIKQLAGGDEGYADLTAWAASTLSREELQGFNTIAESNDPNAIRVAVSGLVARYQAAEGKSPKLVAATSGTAGVATDVYRSWAEVTKDMADPRYKTDPAFNAHVAAKLGRSSVTG